MIEASMIKDGPRHAEFRHNGKGKDYIVGDIHGCFKWLEECLEALEFDEGKDRLFSVGDLVDRGPESHLALEYVRKIFTGVVRGNHEQMMIEALAKMLPDEETEEVEFLITPREAHGSPHMRLWRQNGGGWWSKDCDAREWLEAFASLPFAITINGTEMSYGIIHAQPTHDLWGTTVLAMQEESDSKQRMRALWSRMRYNRVQEEIGETGEEWGGGCWDVNAVFCGHTPRELVNTIDGVVNLDTGAFLACAIPESGMGTLSFAGLDAEGNFFGTQSFERP